MGVMNFPFVSVCVFLKRKPYTVCAFCVTLATLYLPCAERKCIHMYARHSEQTNKEIKGIDTIARDIKNSEHGTYENYPVYIYIWWNLCFISFLTRYKA